jgi:hypothetical protein
MRLNRRVTSNLAVRLRDKAVEATVGQVAVRDPGAVQDRPARQAKAVAADTRKPLNKSSLRALLPE